MAQSLFYFTGHVCNNLGNLSDPSTAYILNSPGPGILANEMIRKGVKSLHLFEKNPDFYKYLSVIRH